MVGQWGEKLRKVERKRENLSYSPVVRRPLGVCEAQQLLERPEQLVLDRAARAAVGELDRVREVGRRVVVAFAVFISSFAFFAFAAGTVFGIIVVPLPRPVVADELGVDVDVGDVVDDAADPEVARVLQQVAEDGGLA